ncbi:helicase RepA family protein [Burkholderia multivorans]|uniref:helicase RepA family protein n=1 Tax=Burkholderia multivorans TaxID=87883 RepID=UPI001C26BD96|nr:helicase RepA family protein [Burkholderia multivorans]MBU9547510.1 helicase RepA family protein [Burkholderia multivorans]
MNYNTKIDEISQDSSFDWDYEGTPEIKSASHYERKMTAYEKWFRQATAEDREKDEEADDREKDQTKKARRTSLKIVMADDLPDEFEAPDELVEGLLTVGAGSILYGDSNSGKTFFAIDLACAVARGEPWMDRRVQQGLVIYVASESPASVRSRVQAYMKYHECKVPNFVIVEEPINLWNGDEDTDLLIESVKEVERATGKKASLIIGDTLARLSAGANENSGEDMGLVVSRFDRVRQETGAHFLLIHHSGKDTSKGARGHSSLRAAVDTEIEVKDEGDVKTASVTKQRDLAGKGNKVGFALHVIEIGRNHWNEPSTTCVVLPAEAPAKIKERKFGDLEVKILSFVDANDSGMTRTEIKDRLETQLGQTYNARSALNAISKLLKDGYLKEDEKKLYKSLPKLGGI